MDLVFALCKQFLYQKQNYHEKQNEYVCNKYGKLNWRDLVSISHEQEPYLSAAEGGVIESFTAYNLIDDHEQEYNAISCRS
jgi:uncharacterized phage-associated protein